MKTKRIEMRTRRSQCVSCLISVALMALGSTAPANAQRVARPHAGGAGSWQVIGTVQANFAADHDTIVVAGPFDNFRKIKFKVTNAPVNIDRMVVVYENGEPDKIDVRQNIRQGGESRNIDLKGVGQRRIRRIDFWYDTKGILKGKANLTVVAMK
jgi:hypothetical protein